MVVAGCAFKVRRISEENQKTIRRKSGDYQKKIRNNHKKIRRRSEEEEDGRRRWGPQSGIIISYRRI